MRVLLLEDNDDGRTALRHLLECWGHEVREETTGVAALGADAAFRPDVAIMDLALPGDMDGWTVARALSARADCPILIAYTGLGGSDLEDRAYDAGFDFFVLKPDVIDELQDLLGVVSQHALRRPR